MMTSVSKQKWVSLCVMMTLLFTAIGPIEKPKILGALSESPSSGEVRNAHDRTMTVQPPRLQRSSVQRRAVRPTLVELLQARLQTKDQWMTVAKAVPVLHADALGEYETVEVTATGYYAGVGSTGKGPDHPQYGITFSGVKVRRDLFSTIAADRKLFPIGTILHVPGYGYGVVADTGSAIKGKKIDLYFHTKQQVYDEWGKKKVKVRVIHRGNGKLTEQELDRLNRLILENSPRKLSV